MSIYINGRFLTQKITGVQRYAIEVVKQLDKMNIDDEIIILHPKNIIQELKLSNIKMKQIGILEGHLWEQISLPIYLKKQKDTKLLSMCNIAPILNPGYAVIHDIAFKTHPEHLNWKFALVYKIITKLNIKRYKHIFTVSEFSKNEILQNYSIKADKITVTYNSADHLKEIIPDETIIDKLNLRGKKFIFSLGSKSPHKNHKFIEECAKNNPDMLFVVSGNDNSKVFKNENKEIIDNLIFTGYLNDNELVAMYKNCDCFIFPSLYEGFGIPPLEAITMGCKKVIVSDIPVFREIYGENVYYVKKNDKYQLNCISNEKDKYEIRSKDYKWDSIAKIIVYAINGGKNAN